MAIKWSDRSEFTTALANDTVRNAEIFCGKTADPVLKESLKAEVRMAIKLAILVVQEEANAKGARKDS